MIALRWASFFFILFLIIPSARTEQISVMTWNISWLSSKPDKIQAQRTQNDYNELQRIIEEISPDFFAFQEVDSQAALAKILMNKRFNVIFSDRASFFKNDKSSQQFTGWAIKKDWKIKDHPDIALLSITPSNKKSRLRYGTHIEVYKKNVKPIHLLSIHLKSGCFSRAHIRKKSCRILAKEIDTLILWVKNRLKLNQSFIITGDFNHYLNEENQWAWSKLVVNLPEKSIINLSRETKANCSVRYYNYRKNRWANARYIKLIDHIIVSRDISSNNSTTPIANQYKLKFDLKMNNLSDHCPIYAKLAI